VVAGSGTERVSGAERYGVNGPRGRSAAWFAAGVLLLAACSDDDDATEGTREPATTTSPGRPGTAPAPTTAAPTTAAPAEEPAFTVGYLAPGVGLLNALGIGQQRGLTLAVDEINAAGGLLGGPIAVVTEEESADRPIDAVLDDLLAQHPDVLVGPVGSASAAAITPLLADRGLLACSASATATSLTAGVDTDDDAPLTFVRTALRDDQFARLVADELMTADGKRDPAPEIAMIVGRDDVYGNELTAGLSAELTARGADVSTLTYPTRRVDFLDEASVVVAADPDVVVLAAYTEAPRLIARIVEAGYDADRIVGLDGLLVPRLAEQTFPSDPARADGVRVLGTTGDRALMARLTAVPAVDDQVSYGPQMYDCVITLALAAVSSGSTEPAAIAQQLGSVTTDGRTCSTFAHCVELLAAGEDIDYDGTTGRIAFDDAGDITTARLVDAAVSDGQLRPVSTHDVDLVAERQQEIFDSAVFVAQLQQALKVLGYYEGDVTGIYDDATTAAVKALQRDLGLPVTGEYDEPTDAALRERLGDRLDAFTGAVSDLQEALTELGYYSGPIDGRYSAETVAAVKAFQRDLGVPPTGVIDVATLRAIYARGQETGAPNQPGPTTTTTTPRPAESTTTTTTTTTTAPASPPPTEAPPPETIPPPETTTPDTSPPPDERSLYEVLLADPNYSTLVEVARAAGYGTDFSAPGPITFFAPTNDAFDALDPERLDELRTDADAADALLRDLGVEGAIASDELTTGALETIGGSQVDVVVDGGAVTYAGAAVVEPDITASNGVAHGIDAVPG
jgi:branched-chain amino acid transport system substrate-binding protein